MKASWIVLPAVLAACILGAGVVRRSESRRMGLEKELAQSKADNVKLREKTLALEAESTQLDAGRAMGAARLEFKPAATPAEEESKPKAKGGFLGKMFKDPEMRKLLAAQQAAALRGLYSDYLTQAQLTPDETERFLQLLQDRQMALMDSSASAMSGGKVDMKAATAVTNATDDGLKDLLGPARYGEYQDFEKTLGVRMQVQQLNQQLAGEGIPLQNSQSTALIRIMSEENAATPRLGSGADMDQYSQQLEATNQRVYNRAMPVLTPPQLSALASFQKNIATAQIAGLKMAKGMLNGEP